MAARKTNKVPVKIPGAASGKTILLMLCILVWPKVAEISTKFCGTLDKEVLIDPTLLAIYKSAYDSDNKSNDW